MAAGCCTFYVLMYVLIACGASMGLSFCSCYVGLRQTLAGNQPARTIAMRLSCAREQVAEQVQAVASWLAHFSCGILATPTTMASKGSHWLYPKTSSTYYHAH